MQAHTYLGCHHINTAPVDLIFIYLLHHNLLLPTSLTDIVLTYTYGYKLHIILRLGFFPYSVATTEGPTLTRFITDDITRWSPWRRHLWWNTLGGSSWVMSSWITNGCKIPSIYLLIFSARDCLSARGITDWFILWKWVKHQYIWVLCFQVLHSFLIHYPSIESPVNDNR